MNRNLSALTDREKDVLRLLARGHDAKSAAQVLDASVNTINERLREARRKLCVSSSREAARVLWEAEGGTQEAWDHKIGVDQAPDSAARGGHLDQSRGKRALLFTMIGVGAMLILALAASITMNLADRQAPPGEATLRPAAEQGPGGAAPVGTTVRPTYSVALAGTLSGKPITIPDVRVRSGGISSTSQTGSYEVHFAVTPDPDEEGNLLVSVSVVIPRGEAALRYSRTLSVAEGDAANFQLEPIGASASPGAVVITARRAPPVS